MQVTNECVLHSITKILQGTGQIWMSNVQCQGFEQNLDACSFTWATEGECNHTADVVVDCFGGNATGQPTTPVECQVNQLQELLTLARDELTRERDSCQTQLSSVRDEMSSLSTTLRRELDARLTEMRSVFRDEMSSLGTNLTRELEASETQLRSLSAKLSGKWFSFLNASLCSG